MASVTVRVSKPTHRTLRQLAKEAGQSMQTVLDVAVEEYRRKQFLVQANRTYQALRDNPKAWALELAERRAWDQTLLDDLRDD
jgi:hypothetical protein